MPVSALPAAAPLRTALSSKPRPPREMLELGTLGTFATGMTRARLMRARAPRSLRSRRLTRARARARARSFRRKARIQDRGRLMAGRARRPGRAARDHPVRQGARGPPSPPDRRRGRETGRLPGFCQAAANPVRALRAEAMVARAEATAGLALATVARADPADRAVPGATRGAESPGAGARASQSVRARGQAPAHT